MKTYSQFMGEITPDELYTGLLVGMIADRLPPMFTMDDFLSKYCAIHRNEKCPDPIVSRYVTFDSIRNTGVPRRMGIPTPFSYEILCRFLKQEWSNIKRHFKERTALQSHTISLIHIRKMKDASQIFKMNYLNSSLDEDVVPDIRLSARFRVEADIATCFPSIYTHALEWAITSRARAKDNVKNKRKEWGGKLDDYVRSIRDNETGGILIGPHASNLISEVILTRVDEILQKNYKYVRRIDDYECYVDRYDKAERFLSDLKDALSGYNLSINYKKVSIKELPLCVDDTWKQQLKSALVLLPKARISKEQIATVLDILVGIMKEHKNGAVFSYAVKAIANRFLTEEARQYYVKYVLHLAYCYPYLYQYLDEYLFYSFDVEPEDISSFADQMLIHGFEVRNFEECSYALFFAIKYAFRLKNFDVDKIMATNDCILLVMAWQYVLCRGLEAEKELLHKHALEYYKITSSFEENWLFVYEALTSNEMTGQWKIIKKSNVSFLKRIEDVYPSHTPTFENQAILWTCRINTGLDKQSIYESFYRVFINDNPQCKDMSLADEYLQCIIGNLLANSRLKKNVRIYRSESYYVDGKLFGRNGEQHDIQLLNAILNWLKANHYIGERRGTKEIGGSCFWPKDTLRVRFKSFNLHCLFRLDESPLVVLKDKNKKIIVPTPESSKQKLYAKQLLEINEMYGRHQFSCKLYGMDMLDRFEPRLKAVFNDSNWEHGGRLYASATIAGFNYQCLPSDMRKMIKVDGENTCEVDYSGLHPHMIYSLVGIQLKGNAYDFLPFEDKALAKFTLLVMLNAKSKSAAIAALEKRAHELRTASGLSPKKADLRNALLRNPNLAKIVDDAARRHSEIRSYFYRGSGIRLQNIESTMALEITHSFAEQDIPVLPVHDSFIIEGKYRKQLVQMMQDVYKSHNNGFTCPVK